MEARHRAGESLLQQKGNDVSFDLLKTAKYVEGLNNAQFRVLFYLLEAANNQTYECFPSMKEIASFTRMSERTVQRHVSDLADMGLFERVEQRRKDGSRAVNLYRFELSGTVKIGRQDPIDVQPVKNGGLMDEQPANSDGGPPSVVTGHISGILSQESIPPLPSGEAPPTEELFPDLPIAEQRGSIIDHVASAWKQLCLDYPRTQEIRVWSDSRKRAVAARASELVRASKGTLDAWQVWDAVFAAIRGDPWLRGEGTPGRGHSQAFSLGIDYVLQPRRFAQILERVSTNDIDNATTSDPRSGRRYGPGEQAIHDALSLLRASGERR